MRRRQRWLVSGPPLLYLLVFFAIPTLIMVLASFRTPGEFGGLAPCRATNPATLDLNVDSYVRFFTESVYAQIFVKSFVVCAGDDAVVPRCWPIRWPR